MSKTKKEIRFKSNLCKMIFFKSKAKSLDMQYSNETPRRIKKGNTTFFGPPCTYTQKYFPEMLPQLSLKSVLKRNFLSDALLQDPVYIKKNINKLRSSD